MFKLVVLSAIFAAAVAKPGLIATPLAYTAPIAYSSVVTPGFTSISQQASSVVHPSPVAYSTPLTFTHFIKKRSAPLFASTYIAGAPLAAAPFATTYSAPLAYSSPALIHGAPILPAAHIPYVASHLIKKRSAPLLHTGLVPTTYAAAQPLLTSTYAATPLVHSAPLIHSVPLISQPIVTPHFIKKRSASLLSAYVAPTAYSHQSRVDYTHTAPLVSTTYSAPFTYSSPLAYTHVL